MARLTPHDVRQVCQVMLEVMAQNLAKGDFKAAANAAEMLAGQYRLLDQLTRKENEKATPAKKRTRSKRAQ